MSEEKGQELHLYHISVETEEKKGDSVIEFYLVSQKDHFFQIGNYEGVMGEIKKHASVLSQDVEKVTIERMPMKVGIEKLTLEKLAQEK
ncbi:MAG: hypothetical protein V2A62_00570 [Candidatus Woesearchaeota archaeon]